MDHAAPRRGPVRRRAAAAALCVTAVVGALLAVPANALPAAVPSAAAPAPGVPATVTFSGAGWGHGVGLSQYGALGMAREGATAEQIVRHYYTGTTVAPVRDAMDLRINLLHRAGAVTLRAEALAPGGGGMQLELAGRPATVLAKKDRVRLVRVGAVVKVVLRPAAGGRKVLGRTPTLTVRWSGTRAPGRSGTAATLLDVARTFPGLNTPGHRYRYGSVQISSSPDVAAGLEVVNLVQLHAEYLLGIAEVPSSWPPAALQAQVLASRSYALSKYGTGRVIRSCQCQMDGGAGPYYDQTFAGYTKESSAAGSSWRAAVLATAASPTTGKAVLYAGKAITAFYSSSSGGRTQSSKDVWGGDLPYAQSVDDHWSLDPTVTPWASWNPRVRTQAQLAAAFGLRDVVTLDLSARTAGDSLAAATGTDSTGRSVTITGATFASRLGLPSRWVWRAADTVSADPVIAAAVSAATAPAGRTVVLAASDAGLDAAVAAAYAGARRLPLLLTPRSGLAAAARAELLRRGVSTVYAVGTSAELPAALLTAVERLKPAPAVIRLSGSTPTDVSVAAATALGSTSRTAVVASAAEPATVLSAAAAAGALRAPLLVLPAGAITVPKPVAGLLTSSRVSSTLVVARPSSVPDGVGLALPGARRVAGSDDADTSAQLALVAFPAEARTDAALANVSGIGSAVAVAATGSPVLWVGSALPASTRALLQTTRTWVLRIVGPVPADVIWAARRA